MIAVPQALPSVWHLLVGTNRLLALFLLALLAGCGGDAKRGPTPEELAAYQARVEVVQGWENEVRSLRGKHHSVVRTLVAKLKTALSDAAKQVSSDEAKSRALKEELHAFARDETKIPTNPVTLPAARTYVSDRRAQEKAFLVRIQDLKRRTPEPNEKRPISSHAIRILDEFTNDVQTGLSEMADAEQQLAAVDPSAPWPPVAEIAPKPPVQVASIPDSAPPKPTHLLRAVTPADPHPAPRPANKPQMSSKPARTDPRPAKPLSAEPKKEILDPPRADWHMSVDPGPKREPVPADLDYRLPASVSGSFYPLGLTRYAALSNGKGWIKSVTLFDLYTGKELGKAGGFHTRLDLTENTGPAISPDGTYLAIYDSTAGKDGGIVVGNLKTQKPVGVLPYPEGRPIIRFPAKDRLLALYESASARLWSLPDQTLLKEFPVGDDIADEPGTVITSPGGRFVGIGTDGSPPELVVFYDLKTGTEAGRLSSTKITSENLWIQGMAFSPDGSEFAMLMYGAGEAVAVWDVQTRRLTYNRPLDNRGHGRLLGVGPEQLQWFPDRQGWLVGHRYVVDRKTARLVHQVRAQGGSHNYMGTKILDDHRVLRTTTGSVLVPTEVPRTDP